MYKKALKLTVAAALVAGSLSAFASHSVMHKDNEAHGDAVEITMYKSPTCGCCGAWASHMEENGFKVKSIPTRDMQSIKSKFGVPDELASCHTAVIGDKVFEGHIPADDIRAYLQGPQTGTVGLAVPGMPLGSPGMEAGWIKHDYEVMALGEDGKARVFSEHTSD